MVEKASDMQRLGIVAADLHYIEELFIKYKWDVSKLFFRWNTELNRIEAYECNAEKILRLICTEEDWWVEAE